MISKHWFTYEVIGLVATGIALIGSLWLTESPLFLISKGLYAKSYRVLKRIAKLNGKKFNKIHFRFSARKFTQDSDEDVE